MGILTNSSGEYTRAKLAAARLDDLFDVVCSRDTLGIGKPDPRAFHEACRRLGSDHTRTLYVGDDAATDPIGAADAGLLAAWLVRDGEPDERAVRLVEARKIPVVRTLGDVLGLLDTGAGRFGPLGPGR